MSNSVAGDIEQARAEFDEAVFQMEQAIQLCRRMHDRVGQAKSVTDIDRLMHESFREDPVAYSLMAFANILVLLDEEHEEGWTGPHLSAALFALDRIQELAATLAALGLVTQAQIFDSEETVSRMMQMLKAAPKGRPN